MRRKESVAPHGRGVHEEPGNPVSNQDDAAGSTPVTAPAGPRRNHALALLALLLVVSVSFVLRHLHVDYGLPYAYHWDEPEIMQPAIRLLRNGQWQPAKFDYGPMNRYIHAAWGGISFLRGNQRGEYPDGIWGLQSERDTGWYWSIQAPGMWRDGRVLSVLLGVLCVIVIFAAVRTFADAPTALFAAAFMGFSSLPIGSTCVISPDAPALLAACTCLWACFHLALHRQKWSYWAAAIAAAAAPCFKYNYAPWLAAPFVAHAASLAIQPGRRFLDAGLVRLCLITPAAAAVFMLPSFLQPTLFLHSLGKAFTYYKAPGAPGILDVAWGISAKFLALHDAGDFGATGAVIGAQQSTSFNLRLHGLLFAAFTLAGLVAAVRSRSWLLLVPLAVAGAVFLLLGSGTQFFFNRYVLPALPCAVVFCAVGYGAAVRLLNPRLPSRVPAGLVVPLAVALVALGPATARSVRMGLNSSRATDPRVQLSQTILRDLPPGSRIMILRESRWFVTPEERKRFTVNFSTVERLRISPSDLTNYDHLIAPVRVRSYASTPALDAQVADINQWLDALPAEMVMGNPPVETYFGKPSVSPGIKLVNLSTMPPLPPAAAPRGRIRGPVFHPGSAASDAISLGENGAIGLKNGRWAVAPVRLEQATTEATVVARGTSHFVQQEHPALQVEVASTTDTLFTAPLVQLNFNLYRSQGGISEYAHKAPLPAGDYLVRIKSSDADNLLVVVESVGFR